MTEEQFVLLMRLLTRILIMLGIIAFGVSIITGLIVRLS